jgi:hypothetical protein
MIPSIKGVALQLAVDGLRRVMEAQKISMDQVNARMNPEDAWVLDNGIMPGLWYPIDLCGRVVELSIALENKGGPNYLRHVGTRIAKMFFSNEIYERFATAAEKRREGAGKIMITVPSVVLNFSEWSFVQDEAKPKTFFIEANQAKAFPDVLRYLSEGFIQYVAERVVNGPVRVRSDRPAPDQIVFQGDTGVT